MDLHEQAFLSAALDVGDERLERRLLVGFHLIRNCCRIADDPTWVPRVAVAKAMMDQAIVDGVFVPGELEFVALDGLLKALDTEAPDRSALHAASLNYGIALMREAYFAASLQVLEIAERLWQPGCSPWDRVEAAYYEGLVLNRGTHPIASTEQLPLVTAARARAARKHEGFGLAALIRLERTMMSGNLRLALTYGERLLEWIKRHPSSRVLGYTFDALSVIHGRGGRFDEALSYTQRSLALEEAHFTSRLNAVNIAGVALTDLGRYDAAQAAFELLLLAPTQLMRRLGWLGLMDLHARRGEHDAFEPIYQRLVRQPLMATSRIQLFLVAGRGWAKMGEVAKARAAFDRAHALARECGYGYEIIETEDDIGRLPDPDQLARAADLVPDVAAHLTALRESHADEIAACMA